MQWNAKSPRYHKVSTNHTSIYKNHECERKSVGSFVKTDSINSCERYLKRKQEICDYQDYSLGSNLRSSIKTRNQRRSITPYGLNTSKSFTKLSRYSDSSLVNPLNGTKAVFQDPKQVKKNP